MGIYLFSESEETVKKHVHGYFFYTCTNTTSRESYMNMNKKNVNTDITFAIFYFERVFFCRKVQ